MGMAVSAEFNEEDKGAEVEDEDETVENEDGEDDVEDVDDSMNSESTESEVNCSNKRRVKFNLSTTEDEDTCDPESDEDKEDAGASMTPTSGEDTTEGSSGSPLKIQTCDAFSKARKKASLKRKQASEFSTDDTTDTGVEVSDNENEQVEDEQSEGSPPKLPKYSSDDDIASDLADSLTPEERAFLGLTSGVADDAEDDEDRVVAEQMTPVSGKNFKVFSSPQVMVVEATSDDTAPKKKRKMTASERLKRKLVDKLDKKHKKAPRMTTNKKKTGSRYYETTNVKNRNRNTPWT